MDLLSQCTLAHWTRHGIGGRRDEVQARALEERALRAGGGPCPPEDAQSLIDPLDPMKDLHP